MNTINRASDPVGTPLVMQVITGTHSINIYVIRRYTPNRASGRVETPLVMRVTLYTQNNYPLTTHVIYRYTSKSCECHVGSPLVMRVNPIDRITI